MRWFRWRKRRSTATKRAGISQLETHPTLCVLAPKDKRLAERPILLKEQLWRVQGMGTLLTQTSVSSKLQFGGAGSRNAPETTVDEVVQVAEAKLFPPSMVLGCDPPRARGQVW